MKKKLRSFQPNLTRLEDRCTPTAFSEPVVLSSVDGFLDVTLKAHQSEQLLETLVGGVPTAILTKELLTYQWSLNSGLASNGLSTGDGFSGPTFKVNRGDTMRIRLENELENLKLTPPELKVTNPPTLPRDPVTEMPMNNHTHGLHISPSSSSDNVLVTLPAGESFVYEYVISNQQPDGLMWMHPHRHEFTSDQVYRGLSSMLIIGDAASGITEVANIPHRAMALQYQLLANPGVTGQSLRDIDDTGNNVSQITINGLIQPTITVGKDQSEVWSIANLTVFNQIALQLRNTNTNTKLPLILIAQDGVALGAPVTIPAGQNITIAPGARLSFLVSASAVAGENVSLVSDTLDPVTKQVKGTTTYVTMTTDTDGSTGTNVPTPATLTADRFFVDLSGPKEVIAEHRSAVFSIDPFDGGDNASFTIGGELFPNPVLFQPRIGTIEQWTITNTSEVTHPFHIHVNDLQVMSIFSPDGSLPNVPSPQPWYQDVVNIPPALLDKDGNVVSPGRVVFRYAPIKFTGSYVYHCHILPHEDKGMMALVTTIPNIPIIAIGTGPGASSEVSVYNSLDNKVITSFSPFGAGFKGGVTTAVADVNNDGISDLIVGAAAGGGPRVRVFNGATKFKTTLFDFFAFNSRFRGGVSVAGDDFNGDGFADIVVGAGPGGGPAVGIFDGKTGNRIGSFYAYDSGFKGGVSLATGDLDGSGFNSLVTGAGPGGGSHVKSWRNSMFYENGSTPILPGAQAISLGVTGQFFAYESTYTGGVLVSTGLNAGSSGGFDRILTGTMTSGPRVTVWEGMEDHGATTMATPHLMFEMVSTFFAFDSDTTTGVRVGSVAVSTGSDFLAATGKGTATKVKRFSLLPGASQPTLEEEFAPFGADFTGGATLGGTN